MTIKRQLRLARLPTSPSSPHVLHNLFDHPASEHDATGDGEEDRDAVDSGGERHGNGRDRVQKSHSAPQLLHRACVNFCFRERPVARIEIPAVKTAPVAFAPLMPCLTFVRDVLTVPLV